MRRKVHLSSLLPRCPRLLPSLWCGQRPFSHTGSIFLFSPSSFPLFFPLSLLLTHPWWKLNRARFHGAVWQGYHSHSFLFLFLSVALSAIILNTQPNIERGDVLLSVFKPHSHRVNDFSWHTHGENALDLTYDRQEWHRQENVMGSNCKNKFTKGTKKQCTAKKTMFVRRCQ